jgi:HAD superfamily hydrolase (TIGR01549 family)
MREKYQAVFFDFDGVILDSVDVKTRAFETMFEAYGPEAQQEVVQYHLSNGGVSRFDKFRYYYENILNIKISEHEVQELSKKFAELVVQGVIDSPFIKGACETLDLIKKRRIPSYVVSGTPHDEINFIVKEKGLSDYFEEVHGSPRKKREITLEIIERRGYNPVKCIFIGDAMSDYEAARKTGMQFLGIVLEGSESPFPKGTKISNAVYVSW